MTWVAVAIVGGAVIGGAASTMGAKKQAEGMEQAADTSLQATRETIASQEKAQRQLINLQKPFRQAGVSALKDLKRYSMGNIAGTQQFRVQQMEGEKAINRAAAARGGFGSTATVERLGEFNRRLLGSESDKQYGRLLDLVNIGRGAATQTGAGVSSTSANIGSAIGAGGSTMAELAMLQGQSRGSAYASLGQLPGQTVTSLANAGAFNQQAQPQAVNPWVTSQNPLGLTPGQGM